jgi:hypothetical protein
MPFPSHLYVPPTIMPPPYLTMAEDTLGFQPRLVIAEDSLSSAQILTAAEESLGFHLCPSNSRR